MGKCIEILRGLELISIMIKIEQNTDWQAYIWLILTAKIKELLNGNFELNCTIEKNMRIYRVILPIFLFVAVGIGATHGLWKMWRNHHSFFEWGAKFWEKNSIFHSWKDWNFQRISNLVDPAK